MTPYIYMVLFDDVYETENFNGFNFRGRFVFLNGKDQWGCLCYLNHSKKAKWFKSFFLLFPAGMSYPFRAQQIAKNELDFSVQKFFSSEPMSICFKIEQTQVNILMFVCYTNGFVSIRLNDDSDRTEIFTGLSLDKTLDSNKVFKKLMVLYEKKVELNFTEKIRFSPGFIRHFFKNSWIFR